MKIVKKANNYLTEKMLKLAVFLMSSSLPTLVFADGDKGNSGDVVKTILQGQVGQTLGKDGAIWGLLTAIGFAATLFHAATTNNPKAVIPGFVLSILVSTVTAYFIAF